jgi:hypothetical protein
VLSVQTLGFDPRTLEIFHGKVEAGG